MAFWDQFLDQKWYIKSFWTSSDWSNHHLRVHMSLSWWEGNVVTGHSVHEVHRFEFPAKTIFANNLKTIDLRVVYYVYLSLAQLSWSKKCVICICTIDNIWNKAKKIFANWGLSSISMDFVYWATCNCCAQSGHNISFEFSSCITSKEMYSLQKHISLR